MARSDYFVQLKLHSNVSTAIRDKIKLASNNQWADLLEQSILRLTIDDFKQDPEIYEAISELKSESRLSVFRFNPNLCYNWHSDKIRHGAINMLLDGFDSFCAFGDIAPGNKYANIHRLAHEPNRYYLINVKKNHCVFNFSNTMRYIVSIGIPDITYEDSLKYFLSKNLVEECI
jgi:hypothetical protein